MPIKPTKKAKAAAWAAWAAAWAAWEWECNLKLRISNYELRKASLISSEAFLLEIFR
jgi:hypothetical protein